MNGLDQPINKADLPLLCPDENHNGPPMNEPMKLRYANKQLRFVIKSFFHSYSASSRLVLFTIKGFLKSIFCLIPVQIIYLLLTDKNRIQRLKRTKIWVRNIPTVKPMLRDEVDEYIDKQKKKKEQEQAESELQFESIFDPPSENQLNEKTLEMESNLKLAILKRLNQQQTWFSSFEAGRFSLENNPLQLSFHFKESPNSTIRGWFFDWSWSSFSSFFLPPRVCTYILGVSKFAIASHLLHVTRGHSDTHWPSLHIFSFFSRYLPPERSKKFSLFW